MGKELCESHGNDLVSFTITITGCSLKSRVSFDIFSNEVDGARGSLSSVRFRDV